jgi:hypothetical protein
MAIANRSNASRNATRNLAAAAAFLWTGAFALSCRLSPSLIEPAFDGKPSAAQLTTDTLRTALGGYFYRQADTYFHQGVGHKKRRAFESGFLFRMSREVAPEEHVHLGGQAIREIMPWLRFAMDCDPRNDEYPMVAAFWLSREASRPDLAHQVLLEARINNPRDCRLAAEEARLCVRQGRTADAIRLFDLAYALWPAPLTRQDDDDARMLKREILLHRGLLGEAGGDKPTALRCFTEILALFPEMKSMQERIDNIRSGTDTATSARDVLKNLIAAQDSLREQCDREDDDAHGESPHD